MRAFFRFCSRRSRSVVLCAVLVCVVSFLGSATPAHAGNSQYFPETQLTVQGDFLNYWRANGGLMIYGLPITSEAFEGGYDVQYFERARFEWHPTAPSQYRVMLGRIGAQLMDSNYVASPAINSNATPSGGLYFKETGHSLAHDFLTYWQAHGGLAQFGYPLSEEYWDGSYQVQWFERAKFEWHPDGPPAYRVLLTHLGRQMLSLRARAQSFTQVVDGQFVADAGLDASPIVRGFNYYPRWHPWRIFKEWDGAEVATELDAAKWLKTNTLRVFISYDDFGGPGKNWSKRDSFRQLLALGQQRGIKFIVSLFDGYRKYPGAAWDTWPAQGAPAEQNDFNFLNNFIPEFANSQAILAWDMFNEPDFVDPTEWQWTEHRSQRIDWLARMIDHTRGLDPNHMITVGLAISDAYFQPTNIPSHGNKIQTLANLVDFISIHYYDYNYSGRSLSQVLSEARQKSAALGFNKPILVEEVGQTTAIRPGASEQNAHAFLASAMNDAASAGVGVLAWTLYDFPDHANDVEGHYGVFRVDGSLKPSAELFLR